MWSHNAYNGAPHNVLGSMPEVGIALHDFLQQKLIRAYIFGKNGHSRYAVGTNKVEGFILSVTTQTST
eukprot:3932028-Amphidinium_carterae.1